MKLVEIQGTLGQEFQQELKSIHEDAFDHPINDKLIQHINKQVELVSYFSYEDEKPIGFKVGCINLNGFFLVGIFPRAKMRMRQVVVLTQKAHL